MIYFIQEGRAGAIKIGFARDSVHQRLNDLQVGNPRRLYCIGVMDGTYADETRLHYAMHAFRVRGEWFSPVPELLLYIQTNTHAYTPDPHTQAQARSRRPKRAAWLDALRYRYTPCSQHRRIKCEWCRATGGDDVLA